METHYVYVRIRDVQENTGINQNVCVVVIFFVYNKFNPAINSAKQKDYWLKRTRTCAMVVVGLQVRS